MLLRPDRPKFLVSAIKNDNDIIYCTCVCVSQPCSLKMATSAAWVSVLEKRGLEIVKRPKTVGWNWEPSFGELLVDALRSLSTEMSDQVTIIIIIKPTYRPYFKDFPARAT